MWPNQFSFDGREKVIIAVALILSFVMGMRPGPNDRPDDSLAMKAALSFARTVGWLTAAVVVIAIYRIFLK